MKIDWKLKGFNLLKFVCNKSLVLHPETCSEMLLMEHDSDLNFKNWITSNGTYQVENSLSAWIANNFIDEDTNFVINANYSPNEDLGTLDNTNSLLLGTINANTEYPGYVRTPFGSAITFGIFKTGNGLSANNGVLTLGVATSNYYGGIKIGYNNTGIPANLPLLLNASGQAYIDTSSLSINNYINKWNQLNDTSISTSVVPSVYIPDSDNFSNINLYSNRTWYANTLYNTIPNLNKTFPVRADVNGHLYTYVPWTNTTYEFAAGNNGFTVSTGGTQAFVGVTPVIANNITGSGINGCIAKFDGTNHITTAAQFGSSTTMFLRNDGQWAVPAGMTSAISIYNLPSNFYTYTTLVNDFANGIESDVAKAFNDSGAGRHSFINVINPFQESDLQTLYNITAIIADISRQFFDDKFFRYYSYSFTIRFILKGTNSEATSTTAHIDYNLPTGLTADPVAYAIDPSSIISNFNIDNSTNSYGVVSFDIGSASYQYDKEYIMDVNIYQAKVDITSSSQTTANRWNMRVKIEANDITAATIVTT